MSFAAEGWAWAQECGSLAAKAVLVCLGWFADKDGEDAYPSMATICRRTEAVERTVRRALDELERRNLIERQMRTAPNGRCISTMYRLKVRETTPAKMHDTPRGTPAKMGDVFMVGEAPATPAKMPPAPCKNAGESINELSKKEKKKPSASIAARRFPIGNWQPSEFEIAWAVNRGLTRQRVVEILIPNFTDHHRSKATLSADWPASWHTWVRHDIEWNPGKPAQKPSVKDDPLCGMVGFGR